MLDEAFDDLEATLIDEPSLDDGTPLDADRANRMLRKIAHLRRELADAEMIAQAETDRIAAWLDDRRRKLSTAELEARLADYHRARLEVDPRAKTIKLPAGDLVSRKRQDDWSIDDETFIAWAKEHRPELVNTRTVVDKAAAKKALEALDDGDVVDPSSGERVPGVTATPGGRSFSVRINAGEEAF